MSIMLFFFFNDTATTEIYTLSLHDALPISYLLLRGLRDFGAVRRSSGYIAAKDMEGPKRNSPPGRPSPLTPYVSNSLAQAKRTRHQTARSNPAYSNPQASGRSLP